MQVSIKTCKGDSIVLDEIQSSDTIHSLMQKLKDREGIPKAPWYLFFKGSRLEEERTLADYNIQENSTLLVGFHLKGEKQKVVVVTVSDGSLEPITIEVEKQDTVDDVKTKIYSIWGINEDDQRLIIGGKLIGHGVIVDALDSYQTKSLSSGAAMFTKMVSEEDGYLPFVYLVTKLRGGGNLIYHPPKWKDSSPPANDNGAISQLPSKEENNSGEKVGLASNRNQVKASGLKQADNIPVKLDFLKLIWVGFGLLLVGILLGYLYDRQ